MNLLVIYLDEAAADEMGLGCVVFSYCYYLTECSWNDASGLLTLSSHHRVGFTAACLPIREDSSIVTVEHILH